MTVMTTSVGEPRTGWIADDSSFGARLALIRQRMSWGNVKEAAEACGLPAESWRRWEHGTTVPRDVVEVAQVISKRTGCDFGWLLAGSRLSRRAEVTVTSRHLSDLVDFDRVLSGRPPGRRDHTHPGSYSAPSGPGRTSRVPRNIAA
jgi:hypothetical protein